MAVDRFQADILLSARTTALGLLSRLHTTNSSRELSLLRSILLTLLIAATTHAQSVDLVTWNIKLGGADPAVIARQLTELPKVGPYLLQEVDARDIGRLAAAIRQAHRPTFKFYLGSLGGSDRLAIPIDESKYRIRSFTELFSLQDFQLNDWRHRSPLVSRITTPIPVSTLGRFVLTATP